MDMMTAGDRLRAYRIDSGLNSVSAFADALIIHNMPVDYHRLDRLEKDITRPSSYEIDAICSYLRITSDCWLRGICNNPSDKLANECQFLNDRQINIILELAASQAHVVQRNFTEAH